MAIGAVGALNQPHEVACPRHVERVARVRDEEQRPPHPATFDAADLLADASQACAHDPEANQLVAAAEGHEVAAVEAAVPPRRPRRDTRALLVVISLWFMSLTASLSDHFFWVSRADLRPRASSSAGPLAQKCRNMMRGCSCVMWLWIATMLMFA